MSQALYIQYHHQSLAALAEKLSEDYHEPIAAICDLLANTLPTVANAGYIEASAMLVEEVEKYINYRKKILLPYAKELHGKDLTGHDCRTCQHKCSIQHLQLIKDLQLIANTIKQLLLALQVAVSIMPPTLKSNNTYLTHRYHTLLLDKTLTELFFLEDTLLIPLVAGAQKNIYANQ